MREEGFSQVILAIESSCDDTSASVIKDGEVLSNVTDNQEVHKSYGGVVPELASRQHHQKIVPVVHRALELSKTKISDIHAVAFTQGPGLLGSLLVGCSFSKGLALALNVPLITVNHMEAHVLAHFVRKPKPEFPFLCLTVSGGHTQLVLMESIHNLRIVGSTLDDAAGEAFDKIGKYLGLEYPAGPVIDRLSKSGKPVYSFPKPNVGLLDFSFSGLKTAVMYFLRDQKKINATFVEDHINDICASVQSTIVNILLEKLEIASDHFGVKNVGIAGGVSANSELRQKLAVKSEQRGWNYYIPEFEFCTDNAGMIAMAAHYKFVNKDFADHSVTPDPRLKIRT